MLSQSGPAYSLDLQPGEGLEIDSVVGYTKSYSWNEVENNISSSIRIMAP